MQNVLKIGGSLVLFSVLACVLRRVKCQCSEAHRQTCSYPYLQLQQITSTTTTGYLPELNETTLIHACNVFSEYMNCSQPFLETCPDEARLQLQTLQISLGLICGDMLDGNVVHRPCHHQIYSSYSSCKKKQVTAIHKIDLTQPQYKTLLCSTANQYVLCVVTATILGCSLRTANVYYDLLNQTISSIFHSSNYQCSIYHPMEVISLYTTTSSTVTSTTHSWTTSTQPGSSDKTEHYREVSSGVRTQIYPALLYMVLVLLLRHVGHHVTS